MNTEHYDVLIIGGGPGGISAASKVVLQGKRAIIINDGPLMGYGIEGAFKAMSLSLLKFVGQASLVDDAMLPS